MRIVTFKGPVNSLIRVSNSRKTKEQLILNFEYTEIDDKLPFLR